MTTACSRPAISLMSVQLDEILEYSRDLIAKRYISSRGRESRCRVEFILGGIGFNKFDHAFGWQGHSIGSRAYCKSDAKRMNLMASRGLA